MFRPIHQPILRRPVEQLEDIARRARLGIPEAQSAILSGFTEAEINTFRMWLVSWDQPTSVLVAPSVAEVAA